jgi:hypothetical protein
MAVKFLNGIDVEGSLNLHSDDIPDLNARKITEGSLDGARLPWNSNDGFTGTYSIVWRATNDLYSSSWLQVRGHDDTLLTRNITADGNVIGNNLNIANWDTAYGWGNHASAGYLTSIPSSYATDAEVNSAVSVVNDRIDTEILPSIPTNNNQLTNGAGYITDGNTNWNNSYGFITEASYIKAGGAGPSTENLNTVANSVVTGELEYRGFNLASSNRPPASDNANGVITVGQHSGNYNAQLAFSSDGNMYWRDNPSSSFGDWRTVWDSGNLSLATLGYTGATNANYITNNNQLTNGAGYATTSYVNTAVSNLVDSAPAALDTLNELAAALGDDADFSTTVTNNIAAINTRIDEDVLTAIPTDNASLANGAGYTTNTGTITGVSTGTGLDGTATSGSVTISLDLSEFTDMTAAVVPTDDEIILLDNGAERKKRFSEIFGSAAYVNTGSFDSAGSAAAVNTALSEEIGNLSTSVAANTTEAAANRTAITGLGTSKQNAGNYFTDGDTVLNMANNDGLVYDDTNNRMYVKLDGTNREIYHEGNFTPSNYLSLNGGTATGTIAAPTFDATTEVTVGPWAIRHNADNGRLEFVLS